MLYEVITDFFEEFLVVKGLDGFVGIEGKMKIEGGTLVGLTARNDLALAGDSNHQGLLDSRKIRRVFNFRQGNIV